MDNIKILEEIGLKKVYEDTHIEQKYLKHMVDCNFDKLDYINTRGFIKILEREYKLDLSEWIEVFEEYWEQNRKAGEDDGLFVFIDDKKRDKKPIIFIVVVLIVVSFGLFFSYFQERVEFVSYVDNNEAKYEQATVVQKTKEILFEANNSFEKESIEESLLKDENITLQEDVIVYKETDIEEISIKEQKFEEKEIEEFVKKADPILPQEVIITPNLKLWVGVIYLDTKKRRSFLGEGNFSIDISKEQIITTGHGDFDLNIAGEKKEFNIQTPMRFLVKDSNLTQISLDRFKELNEGIAW